MGISSPDVGYQGYRATDDTLFKDTTVYTSTTAYPGVKLLTGSWMADVSKYSTLRFKLQMHTTGAISAMVYVKVNGVGVPGWDFSTTNNVYEAKTADQYTRDASTHECWRRASIMDLYGCANPGATLSVKDIEFAGAETPVRMWIP